jgi:SAM-dependent methyltransferase
VEPPVQSPAPCLPSWDLAIRQSEWLRPARSRLLRTANLSRARNVLDLASGWGQIAVELAERSGATVVGVDCLAEAVEWSARRALEDKRGELSFLNADAHQLPLPDSSQDLIFIQCGMLWMRQPEQVIRECQRLLRPGGSLVMIEPDYGGMMESPEAIESKAIWVDALQAAGADPMIGRKLLSWCAVHGLVGTAYFFDRYQPPQSEYLRFLKELPLNESQLRELRRIDASITELPLDQITVHLPFWMLVARRV